MKIISFVIPSYNSEVYLHNAVDSLLSIIEDVEIIIVNDGSKDKTLEVANKYKALYPKDIRVIDKKNGGHGSGVNEGLKHATGLYFKVLDSDDWMNEDALNKLINQMKIHIKRKESPDLYITNFVYEHVEDNTTYERDYSDNFPEHQLFDWNHLKKKFKYSKTLLMHALIYKTQVLREVGLNLPEHTFYVDNIVAYVPLPFVKSMYYMRLPLYRYFIGRSDQSVTLENITGRYMQQIKVFGILSETYSFDEISRFPKGLKTYMNHFLASIMTITQMFTVGGKEKKRKADLKTLWKKIKQNDIRLYRFLRYRSNNTFVNFLPWPIKKFVMVQGYKILVRKVKLG